MAIPARIMKASGLSVDEAIQYATDQYHAGRRLSVALDEDDIHKLSQEAVTRFALTGWRHLAGNALARGRCNTPTDEGEPTGLRPEDNRPSISGATGRNPRTFQPLEDIALIGADGYPKPLREFTPEDLERLHGNAKGRRVGWAKREKWSKDTRARLAEHGVGKVGDLPEDVLEEVEQQARSAWGAR